LERVNVLAKQVLSQLSYTPTKEATFILKHFRVHRILVYFLNPSNVKSAQHLWRTRLLLRSFQRVK